MSAVLLEQSAVWAYSITENCRAEDISDERIYMNMINSFLGRMHLAGHLERLNDRQLSLVKEGVDYYKSLTPAKKKGLPKFPIGFNKFSNDWVVAGFETDEKLYLAVWNPGNKLYREIPLKGYKKRRLRISESQRFTFYLQKKIPLRLILRKSIKQDFLS